MFRAEGSRGWSYFFLRMPRTSSSRMMRNSSPSILISVPEYLPNRTRSPDFTSRGKTLPSSLDLPLPTEMTSPSWGFSLAESGMMMPPRIVSPSSIRRTRMRSWSGVKVVATDAVAIALLLLGAREHLSVLGYWFKLAGFPAAGADLLQVLGDLLALTPSDC